MDLIGPAKNGDGVCRLGFFGILPRFSRHGQRADSSVCPLRIWRVPESSAPERDKHTVLGSSGIGGFGSRRVHIVYSPKSDIDFARIRANIEGVSSETVFPSVIFPLPLSSNLGPSEFGLNTRTRSHSSQPQEIGFRIPMVDSYLTAFFLSILKICGCGTYVE